MIDLDDWIRELDEQPDREIIDHAAYQKQLFSEYVIRNDDNKDCLLYTSPSPRDRTRSRMPSSA